MNLIKSFSIDKLDNIDIVANEFVEYISNSPIQSNIFAFFGKMGVGKTTFIKAICKVLEVDDIVNSPTFTIINEYKSKRGFPIYHFDFYRINKIEEAYDVGINNYFGSDGLCLIEWSEKIESLLPEDTILVNINALPNGVRQIDLSIR